MNRINSTPANLERIHPALAHWGWHLVEARDDWFQDDQKIRAFYVIDANGVFSSNMDCASDQEKSDLRQELHANILEALLKEAEVEGEKPSQDS